ncbi:MAG: AraC family transcriptional regulator [Terrimicrobiaceae bacterium]
MLKKIRYHRVHALNRHYPFQVVFSDFHCLDMRKDHEYPGHSHTGYEAILVEKGLYLCGLNQAELVLQAGEVLMIKPGDRHADHLRKGQRHYVLHFSLESTGGARVPELFAAGVRPGQQIARGSFARDTHLLEEIQREARGRADHAAAVQDGLLTALFWRWIRALPAEALSREWRLLPTAEARREEITGVLKRHQRDNRSVAELARELGVSPRQLTTQCRTLLGAPPARLLLDLKLREAEAMLRHQSLRVSEVSDALGFANPFHFSRVCSRAWGHAPSVLLRD